EMLTLTLVLGMVSVGAIAAAIVAGLGAGSGVQVLVFAGASLATLLGLRPIVRRHLHTPVETRTGVDALIGKKVLVLERVDAHGGRVKLGGEIWTARAYDSQAVLEPGDSADVVKIDGATALVL